MIHTVRRAGHILSRRRTAGRDGGVVLAVASAVVALATTLTLGRFARTARAATDRLGVGLPAGTLGVVIVGGRVVAAWVVERDGTPQVVPAAVYPELLALTPARPTSGLSGPTGSPPSAPRTANGPRSGSPGAVRRTRWRTSSTSSWSLRA